MKPLQISSGFFVLLKYTTIYSLMARFCKFSIQGIFLFLVSLVLIYIIPTSSDLPQSKSSCLPDKFEEHSIKEGIKTCLSKTLVIQQTAVPPTCISSRIKLDKPLNASITTANDNSNCLKKAGNSSDFYETKAAEVLNEIVRWPSVSKLKNRHSYLSSTNTTAQFSSKVSGPIERKILQNLPYRNFVKRLLIFQTIAKSKFSLPYSAGRFDEHLI